MNGFVIITRSQNLSNFDTIGIYKISRESYVREPYYVKCNRMRARARSKAMWLNSVLLGRFEVAGWGGCGGCGDGWASLMKVQAVDVCGNDGGVMPVHTSLPSNLRF